MTLEDFIAQVRSDLEDVATPYLWSDTDIVRYTNRALNEFAKPEEQGGASYFFDRSTWLSVPVTTDDPFITLDPSKHYITKITRAWLDSRTRTLSVMSTRDYERGIITEDYGTRIIGGSRHWETSKGTPEALLLDYVEDGYRLAPIPTVDDTLSIWAYRLPLTQLAVPSGGDAAWKEDVGQNVLVGGAYVENDEETLLLGAKAYAYASKHDSDAFDASLRDRLLGDFQIELGRIANRTTRSHSTGRPVVPNADYYY